jgi:hypothetical protein
MPAFGDSRLDKVAKLVGISVRTARRWRDSSDPRWEQFYPKSKKAVQKENHNPTADPVGQTLNDEVIRLGKLASDLAGKINLDEPEDRSALISDYTKVIDQLRKLRADRPDIEEREGNMISVDEADKILKARDEALIPLLRGMSKRLAPICYGRSALEIETEIEREVGQIMREVESALK